MKIGSKVNGAVASLRDIGRGKRAMSNPPSQGYGVASAQLPTLIFTSPSLEFLLCHWTFDVRCSMFGVSVLISDFRRLIFG
jgi:hypothetical protein